MSVKGLKKANKRNKEKAEQIIKQTMIRTKEQFPVLIYAINLLKPKVMEETECEHLSTDGEYLFYNPSNVIDTLKEGGYKALKRELLHIVMHGLLGHFDTHILYRDRQIMWASMDREVEWMLDGVLDQESDAKNNYYFFEDEDEDEYRVAHTKKQMKEYLGDSYGLACYYKVKGKRDLRKKLLHDWWCMKSDDHKFWLSTAKRIERQREQEEAEGKKGGKSQKGKISTLQMCKLSSEKRKEISKAWETAAIMLTREAEKQNGNSILMAIQINSSGDGQGRGSGNWANGVRAVAENQNSYYDILMEFMRMKDTVKEEPDAIDPMLYHYGLEMYGDVPLIESPEETEQLNINTICIAMDTSGSCSGDVARHFVRETANILRDVSLCSVKGEIYFWTCDYEIQQEKYYEEISEVDTEEWEQLELEGWGGTSFIPVFEKIKGLQKQEKVIDCLIYLTDGYGDFPDEEPDYPVYFILSEGKKQPHWPDWIHYISLNM